MALSAGITRDHRVDDRSRYIQKNEQYHPYEFRKSNNTITHATTNAKKI
jgi:hypothetical protein